jgi:hypothetical protein
MLHDPAFISDADGLGLDVAAPRSGEQLAAVLKEAYAASPETVKRIRDLIAGDAK